MNKTLKPLSIAASIARLSAGNKVAEPTFQTFIGGIHSVTGVIPMVGTVLSPTAD